MMLHRHFDKREEKPAKKPVDMKIQEGHDIIRPDAEPVAEEPVKRGRKRKTEE